MYDPLSGFNGRQTSRIKLMTNLFGNYTYRKEK